MNAASELRKARTQAGLSQRQLAVRARLPQSTIARIESGVVSPRLDTFEWLLGLCGCRLWVRRMGDGIDRTVMRERLKLTPSELLELATQESRNLDEFLRETVRR